MKRVMLILMAMFLVAFVSCSQMSPPTPAPIPDTVPTTPVPITEPAPAPVPSPVPMPGPVLVNSASESEVAELEAEIRRLESENRRLMQENQQLNNELITVTAVIEDVTDVVDSSSYSNVISDLSDVQSKANELADFAAGLPQLPPPPPGITVSKINDAIQKAKRLRGILEVLPPPPPLAPSWWTDLDDMKNAFIDLTEWMEDLRDIPQFLESSEDLDELRYRMGSYLDYMQNTALNAEEILEIIRQVLSR